MRKKIITGVSALIVVLIIVAAIILCLKISRDEKDQKDVNIYNENNVTESENIDIAEAQENQIITSDELMLEYNKDLYNNREFIENLLLAKNFKYSIDGIEFDNGKFTEDQKFNSIFLEIDDDKEVKIYDTSYYMVSMEDINEMSQKIFNDKIDVSKMMNITIENGKVKYIKKENLGSQIFKAKSLVYNEATKIYTFVFDLLNPSYKEFKNISSVDIVKYNKEAVLGTFELLYQRNDLNNNVLIELNML